MSKKGHIMKNTVVVGAQWGDEGKAKITDLLAEYADVIIRYQGGCNAGHTVVANGKTFKYPFNIYSEGRIIDIDNYGFEEGQEYTEKQISDVMLKHKHYEFGGKLEFNFIEEDNVITVNAIQHKKG